MKFLFMIFHDEKTLDALPEPQMQTLVDSALDYMEELRRSGHFIVSNALQRARTHFEAGRALYEDLAPVTPGASAREPAPPPVAPRGPGAGRPTKQDRRAMARFTGRGDSSD